jgi:hypothetical protein
MYHWYRSWKYTRQFNVALKFLYFILRQNWLNFLFIFFIFYFFLLFFLQFAWYCLFVFYFCFYSFWFCFVHLFFVCFYFLFYFSCNITKHESSWLSWNNSQIFHRVIWSFDNPEINDRKYVDRKAMLIKKVFFFKAGT